MSPIAIASPNRMRKDSFDFALAPLMVAMTAATSSVSTMGLANCAMIRFSALGGGADGSSFAPYLVIRSRASESSSPRTGSAVSRRRCSSTGPL
jgi:hypothetical protein